MSLKPSLQNLAPQNASSADEGAVDYDAFNDDAEHTQQTMELLKRDNMMLRRRLNQLETQLLPKTILESLMQMVARTYSNWLNEAGRSLPLPLAHRFYVVDEKNARVEVPKIVDRKIESLWWNRITSTDIQFRNQTAKLMLHPSQLKDDRPMPIVVCQDGTTLAVVRRLDERTHSHLLKNDPQFPGVVVDSSHAQKWLEKANLTSSQDTSVWPMHAMLERLAALWLGREPNPSSPQATLVVDAKQVREFVHAIASNPHARCHFTCCGKEVLHAYLCLTANDGRQTDLARMAIGSVKM